MPRNLQLTQTVLKVSDEGIFRPAVVYVEEATVERTHHVAKSMRPLHCSYATNPSIVAPRDTLSRAAYSISIRHT